MVNALTGITLIAGTAAIVEDLLRRRISNWISGGAALGGLVCHVVHEGWHGALTTSLGAATGFGLFFLFYLGGRGGGDVKLMAGFGSLLGAFQILEAALLGAIFGGLIAVIYIVAGARNRARPESIPYAPAIVLGAWLVLLGHVSR